MAKPLPKQQELLGLLRYDPKSGRLYFRERCPDMFPDGAQFDRHHSCAKWNTRLAGRLADTEISNAGYRRVVLWKQRYAAHRIVWKMLHGEDPAIIDHKNGCRADNRERNLINGTRRSNQRNTKRMSNNTSGRTGVHWCNTKRRWIASVVDLAGKRRKRSFLSKAEAVAGRHELQKGMGYTERHGRREARR